MNDFSNCCAPGPAEDQLLIFGVQYDQHAGSRGPIGCTTLVVCDPKLLDIQNFHTAASLTQDIMVSDRIVISPENVRYDLLACPIPVKPLWDGSIADFIPLLTLQRCLTLNHMKQRSIHPIRQLTGHCSMVTFQWSRATGE